MAEQKKKIDKRVLTGFILVILSPVLVALLMGCFNIFRKYISDVTLIGLIIAFAIVLPVIGRIFSIIGLIVSIVRKGKGKGLAIAAIVLGELEFFVYVCYALFWILVAVSGDSRPPVH